MRKFVIPLLCAALVAIGCDEKSPDPKPVKLDLTLDSESVAAPVEGGSYSVGYTVSIAEAKVTASASANWVRDLSVADGKVTFSIPENLDSKVREATVTVSGSYEGNVATRDFTVAQEASEYDVAFVGKNAIGELKHIEGAPLYNQVFHISDKPIGSGGRSCIELNCLIERPSVPEEMSMREGTYTVNPVGEHGTIYSAYYYKTNANNGDTYEISPIEFKSGTVTVTKDGDDYLYVGTFVDPKGKTYKFTYSGLLTARDMTGNSYLYEDITIDPKPLVCNLSYAGKLLDYWGWKLELIDGSGDGQTIFADLFTEESSVESGLPEGVFTASSVSKPWSFSVGRKGSVTFAGSWFQTVRGNSVYAPSAPLVDGKITVKRNSVKNYTIIVECFDDAIFPHKIYCEWTGDVKVYDES